MDTVLVVDDDRMMRHVLRLNLENENIVVIEAAFLKRLFDIIQTHSVDLILLDLGLPDGNGMDFIRDIRSHTNAPLLIVSGDDEASKKMEGLNLGADDYIAKPFNVNELVARVKSNLRRYKGDNRQAVLNDNKNVQEVDDVTFGSWILRRSRHQVFDGDGRSCDLTAQEFRVLDLLIRRQGQVIRRDELCEAVRDESNYAPSERAIDIKIMRIRKKLEDSENEDSQFIKTIRGVGYMFNQAWLRDG